MLDSDWSRNFLLRSDWLLPVLAPITTGIFLRLFMRHTQFFLSGQRIGSHIGSVS